MNQKGFAPLIVLLILAGIFVVGAVGYYLYPAKHPAFENFTQPTSTTPVTSHANIPAATNQHQPSCTFSAYPNKIIVPQSSLLVWSCQDASACTITNDKSENVANQISSTSGTLKINPNAPTIYTLTCLNANNVTTSQSVTVSVGSGIENCGGVGCE